MDELIAMDQAVRELDYTSKYTQDPIVNNVIKSFVARSNAGMLKYGMTMKDNPLETIAWARHAQEEAMDFICYLERLIDELQKGTT